MASTVLFGLFCLVFGVTSLLKPEWYAAIERLRRASASRNRPEEIELSDSWYGLTQATGLLFALVGLVVLLGTLV